MTPTLARFIRLARNRIYGTELEEDAKAEAQQAEALQQFKLSIAAKIRLAVRYELFSSPDWQWHPEGCSVQFAIDEHTFVLQQSEHDCKLFHRVQGRDVPLAMLAADDSLEDHLLIAIDDAMNGCG